MTARLRSYAPRHYGTLKEAATALVEAAGSLEAAAALTRVARSTMHGYTDPEQVNVHMPLDVAVVLERCTSCHAVTEFLAREAGMLLLPLPIITDAAGFADDLARLGKEVAEVFGRGAEFLRDGSLSPAEASALLKEIDDSLGAGGALRAHVAAKVPTHAPRKGRGRRS